MRLARAMAWLAVLVVCAGPSSCGMETLEALQQVSTDMAGGTSSMRSNVTNAAVTIRASSWQPYVFSVTERMHDAVLQYEFHLLSGRDAQLLVFDNIGSTNWVNGHSVTPIHSTKRLAAAQGEVELPGPGTYVIIVSNRWSLLTSKMVSVRADLTYTYMSQQASRLAAQTTPKPKPKRDTAQRVDPKPRPVVREPADDEPPTVTIVEPRESPTTTENSSVWVLGSAQPNGKSPIESAIVFVNGDAVLGSTGRDRTQRKPGEKVDFGRYVPLSPGRNVIRVMARTSNGLSGDARRVVVYKEPLLSLPPPPLPPPAIAKEERTPPTANLYVVAIG
ncbi:hypothetical protein HN371_22420, partial [Candidatus Poribacteria bacterium]|nr:hypothetical protein [Candidatus Poribacteria bacterium]